MKLNYKEFRKWIEALDSGDFEQTRETLQDDRGYCCMGVACEVLIPVEKIERAGEYMRGYYPSGQPCAPKWLKLVNDDFDSKVMSSLDDLNDSQNMSFPEIATMLELVYIHKALK